MQKALVDRCIEEADRLCEPFMVVRDQGCEEPGTHQNSHPREGTGCISAP